MPASSESLLLPFMGYLNLTRQTCLKEAGIGDQTALSFRPLIGLESDKTGLEEAGVGNQTAFVSSSAVSRGLLAGVSSTPLIRTGM
jgi:hypothetical protein